MSTQLSDMVIVPEIFVNDVNLMALELNNFYRSGVAVRDAKVASFLGGELGGQNISFRQLDALDGSVEANISDDVVANKSTAQTLSAVKTSAVVQTKNQSWTSMDLTAELNGVDPLNAVTTGVSGYWATQDQTVILKSLEGVLADNIANNGGDMVVDVSAATDVAVVDTNRFSREAFTNALLTSGDRLEDIKAMAVHSVIYGQMIKNDDIEFLKESDGKTVYPSYMGKRVILDDAMTATVYGTSPINIRYNTILFGEGAIALENGITKTPFAIERDETAGNGGGEESLFYRKQMVAHPYGFKWDANSVASATGTPSWAELTDATNWTRVYDRKRVKITFLVTN
jgi:hypothetical protein